MSKKQKCHNRRVVVSFLFLSIFFNLFFGLFCLTSFFLLCFPYYFFAQSSVHVFRGRHFFIYLFFCWKQKKRQSSRFWTPPQKTMRCSFEIRRTDSVDTTHSNCSAVLFHLTRLFDDEGWQFFLELQFCGLVRLPFQWNTSKTTWYIIIFSFCWLVMQVALLWYRKYAWEIDCTLNTNDKHALVYIYINFPDRNHFYARHTSLLASPPPPPSRWSLCRLITALP